MKLFYRAILTLVLIGVLVISLLGFFASSDDYQASRRLPWRLVCLAGIVGCVTGTLMLWTKESDESN